MKQKFEIALCLVAFFGAAIAFKFAYQGDARKTVGSSIANPVVPHELNLQNKIVPSQQESLFDPIAPAKQPAFKLVLPTLNEEIFNEPKAFYMHTNRYKDGINLRPWQGGMYGFSRTPIETRIGTVYTKLHEGMDIKPLKWDENKQPLDEVFSISDGEVVYVNSTASRSNYGKYVVVKHQWPEGDFYSLYAHLAKTTVSQKERLLAGDSLGIMGYTGAGIKKDRAHVHVELALMANPRFNTSFRKDNCHFNFNGQNLVGIDIARLFKNYSKNPYLTIAEFLAEEQPYFTVQTSKATRPEILNRHPWLGVDMELAPDSKSWEVTFNRSGVPLSIRPTTKSNKYNQVVWVKDAGTNHSYMTSGRLTGSGSTAKLSSNPVEHRAEC